MKIVSYALSVILVVALLAGCVTAPAAPSPAKPAQVEVVGPVKVELLGGTVDDGLGGAGGQGITAYNTACYREQEGNKIVCGPGGTFEVVSGGTLDVQTGATLQMSAPLDLGPGSSVTAANGAAFAASSASLIPLTASGNVTPTITIPAAGLFVCLYNTSANTILIQDTGNQVLTSNWSGGQYDTLCGFSDGTRFIELFRANN